MIRPQPDTNRFATPAVARRCADGRTLLLEGVGERGDGVLVWLRYGDTLAADTFRLSALADSTVRRGATVAVRYMTGEIAHGFALDQGRLELTEAGPSFSAHVSGSGLEGSVRNALTAEYADVPLAADTVPCRFAP